MTSDYEPDSGYNLPPGCLESEIDRAMGGEDRACGECLHCLEGCCDYGICEIEFEKAFDDDPNVGTDNPGAEWRAALWALDWIVEHYKDMQEDTCEDFSRRS